MNPKIGLAAPPKKISKDEYKVLLEAFTRAGRGDALSIAYKENRTGESYNLNSDLSAEQLDELWEHYFAAHVQPWKYNESWEYSWKIEMIRHYICDHRLRFKRIGDDSDDRNKASYLFYLVGYIHEKHSRVIPLRKGVVMDEIINEVNNIYDSAFFRKRNHPEVSDEECFFQAECEFCEDKKIDYLVFRLHMDEMQASESVRQEDIRVLAYQRYEWRTRTRQAGDDKSDWVYAENEYPEWKAKQRIAETCYNIAPDSSKSQDQYWTLAGKVIEKLRTDGVNYVGVDSHESEILSIIVDVVARQRIAEICQAIAPGLVKSLDEYLTLAGKVIEKLKEAELDYFGVDLHKREILSVIKEAIATSNEKPK